MIEYIPKDINNNFICPIHKGILIKANNYVITKLYNNCCESLCSYTIMDYNDTLAKDNSLYQYRISFNYNKKNYDFFTSPYNKKIMFRAFDDFNISKIDNCYILDFIPDFNDFDQLLQKINLYFLLL